MTQKDIQIKSFDQKLVKRKQERLRQQADQLLTIHTDFDPKTTLLRASQSASSPDTLLRPAQAGEDTKPDLLLRASTLTPAEETETLENRV